MQFLSTLRTVTDRISASASYGLAGAGVVSMVAMMFIVTFDVILRYFFNAPTVWAGEVASFLTISVVFLGLAQNIRLDGHIRIDVFTNLMPERTRLLLNVIAHAVAIIFSVALLMACWLRFENFWIRQTVSDSPIMVPLWIPMVPVLIGAVGFCLASVAGFIAWFHALLTPDPGATSLSK